MRIKKGNPIVLSQLIWICACSISVKNIFPVVPILHHECHAWPSTLPLKMTMSCLTFCKFCKLDKSVIAKKNAMVWLLRLCHLMPFDHFLSGNLNVRVLATSFVIWGSFMYFWHELMDVWAIIWPWWGRTFRTCSTAVRFALKSEVDMLKMWVHKSTRTENIHNNHYQNKSW